MLCRRKLAILGCVAVAATILPVAASSQPTGGVPLTVVVLGKGAIVASRPAGISCPGRCTATFASGTHVTLNPRLKVGFKLVRWAGGCKGSGSCAVRVSSPSAVTAVFAAVAKSRPHLKPTAPHHRSKVIAEPGYYSGAILFFVSTSGAKVQNVVTYNPVSISCVPAVSGAPSYDRTFAIPAASIRKDGSFAGRMSQGGVFDGFAAKFTYSVSGHLTPASTAGAAASAAGSYREDISFKDTTATHTCTTNNQPWSSTKYGPIPSPRSLVVPGKKYTGSVVFSVSAAGGQVQSVTTYNPVPISCVPAVTGTPTYDSKFSIPAVVIRPDGSFSGRSTQTGVFGTAPATITYSVSGNFQGLNGSYATAAGSYRVDIAFTDSAGAHTCTSNTTPFSASG